ncbi:MAG: hypothetical protein F6K22_02080 [Okeania sp. SIO2F4]|uniref:DNA N-6-adenine-methyltransferase n=1 Tax=Okeania sp. SIO2F4 TaxID=2607790 RepID=UPI00142CB767|nr:DNA N-6-adenine-methyltransferase [Okeania sp. SIO2F4]NES01714.1 hypothetical protein [Okeania sp. SIO2F4]
MMNTSAIKQQEKDLISILTSQLEKEKKDSISILTTLLEQKKSQLKELQSIPTKISRALDTLLPILAEYPEYKKAIASQLGLALPPPSKSRVIEITDGQKKHNHQTIEKPQPENNPTPTITIKEIITELTSTFPKGWKYNETDSTWEMALTETEVTRITQLTNNFTGTIELKEKLYQWSLQETDGDLGIIILTLQEENNNDTTSDNNAETDSTHIEKSGDVPTPPTSDMVEISDTAPSTLNISKISSAGNNNNPTITWYDSSSGEVILDNEHRYFKVFYDVKEDDYEIRLKKSETAKKWSKNTNSTTQKFIDAVWKNTKNNPSNKENGGLKQELHNAATEIGGKFCQYPSDNITSFGFFYIKDQKIAEVGYQNNSWWFIAPGKNQVYCSGDAATFTQVLKGLATEESPYSNEEEIDKIATTFDTRIENASESNPTQTTSKSSDCWYTPPQIVELIEEVLGTIDLDPCADDKKHIPAKYHKTITEDGLSCVWHGKVFLNPPYSCPGKWIEKLISEIDSSNVTEAIALLTASTDTKWFEPLWSQPICFWKGRIKFLDSNYKPKSPARQSHCLVYWGENVDKFSQVFNKYGEVTHKKKTQETLTFFKKIEQYLPPTWILEEHLFNQVIIKEKNHQNNHVELCNSTIGDIYIRHNQELLYTIHYQDIETAIDLIYCWFEQRKSVTKPSINPPNPNKNSSNKIESGVESEPVEVEKTLTLTEKITPLLLENWVIETVGDSQVLIYSSDNNNSDWVKITELHNYSNTPFIISHGTEFSNNAKDIKSALERAKWWFESTNTTDYFEIFIEIINSYKTDLTIVRNDSSTAYIQRGKELFGTVFYKDNEILELPEREKQLLKEAYSINIDELIQDINNKEIIDEGLINNYLLGIGSLDEEFDHLDTLHNALHSLSNKFKNKFRLVIIRQGRIFKIYNGIEWLENYLGSVTVNNPDSEPEIILDENLVDKFLNQYSILLNQLTTDIVKGETEIETDNYIITNQTIKELLTKENWDNWNEEDFKTANNLLNELVDFSPAWNQLLETLRQQRKELIEQTIENDEDNPDNNGGSKTPPSTPNNPNNNSGIEAELNTKHLDTLETAINSYKTDLQLDKNCSQIAFYQGHFQLGFVTINQGKLSAESKLVSHLITSYGIDIKGLIKSIHYNSKHPSCDVDPFAYIGSNNNALKPRGCVVAPIWEKGRERRGILQSVSGEIATIQWLDSGVLGDNGIEHININLLRYVSAQPLTKLGSSQVSAISSDNLDSDEPTAESMTSLDFSSLIVAASTQRLSTVANTQLNTEELADTERIIDTVNNANDTTDNQTESNGDEPTVESRTVLKVDQIPSQEQETGTTLSINEQNLTINGKAISFGKTLTELLSGNKTVTRRFWKDNYAQRFIDDWNARPGKFLYPALTKGYHVGGKRVGYIRLTHKPYQEKLVDMPSSELAAEGFPELSKQQFIGKFFEGDNQQIVWVIRFEFIPDKEYQKSSLSQHKKTQTSLEEQLINKVKKQLSMIDKFQFERSLGIPKITLHISLKDEILGRIFTDPHKGLVSDISLEKLLMERYELDIKALILDVVNGKQLQIENYRKQPENNTTTKGDTEIIENIASYFFDEYDDQTWLNLIKTEIELLEDFKASHDEVDLTVTHYGTNVGSIHHNQDDELEIEQKLIGELAKYDCDLEAFLVAENIPYQLYHPKPVVTNTQTSEHTKKSIPGKSNGKLPDSNQLNNDADTKSTEHSPVDLLDKLAAVFNAFDNIRTKRSGTTLWFYRGDKNLYPCLMQTRDGKTFTLFPTVKLKSNMKELFGIDVDQLCSDLEAGQGVDINDYVDHSVWEQTIKDSHKNNDTITWQDILNNAAINDTTDSQTSDEFKASTTTEESNTDSYEHSEGLHWVKDSSIYNRSETYIVWNGTQKCGKIHICNKSKNKAGFGKWYVSTNVFGPYYDTIEKAATACWEDFISQHAEQTETEEELIPF